MILARVEIDYRRPARYGEVLEIRVGLERIGRTSFTYIYEVLDKGGNIVANARTVQVMYDYTTAQPVPLTDELRARLGEPGLP